ncbi:MAG: spore germination protein GerW family protein [Acidimicrobiales bacterium]
MELGDLFERVGSHLSVSRAFGPAYERDGVMVIPVALVAGGGGGGQGTDGSGADHSSSGSGGGFGGTVIPFGAYEVRDGRVRWVPSVNVNLLVATLVVLGWVLRRRRRRS